jgi:hypothetical protein
MQGLDFNSRLKVPKKLCHTRERRPGLKRPEEERPFLTYNLHVPKRLVVCID